MLAIRKTEAEIDITTHEFQIGDQIVVDLKGFGKFTATAQKIMNHGMVLFLMDECVCKERMCESSKFTGDFAESSLRKWMNETLFESFPDDLKEHMVPFDDGDFLTIPTYGQIYGHDYWYKEHANPDQDEQLPLMKHQKYKLSYYEDKVSWYWLKNTLHNAHYSCFCVATDYGSGNFENSPLHRVGVRPVFVLTPPPITRQWHCKY